MAWLVESTLPSGLRRMSDERHALEHPWFRDLTRIDSCRVKVEKQHGGYAKPTWGKIQIKQKTFLRIDGDWPPPMDFSISKKHTATDEAAAVTVFEGTAHRAKPSAMSWVYDLYGPEYEQTVTDRHYTGTVLAEFTWAAGELSLTLDSSATARAGSITLDYTATGEKNIVKTMSEIAWNTCHCFEIDGSTLYLSDMLADNGILALGPAAKFDADYQDSPPYAKFTGGDYEIAGTHPAIGRDYSLNPVCVTGQTATENLLTDIKTIMGRLLITLKMPMFTPIPPIGRRITWTDRNLSTPTAFWMRVRSRAFDHARNKIILTGEGDFA